MLRQLTATLIVLASIGYARQLDNDGESNPDSNEKDTYNKKKFICKFLEKQMGSVDSNIEKWVDEDETLSLIL